MLKRISEFSSYVISRFKRAVDCVNRWFTGSLFRHVVSMLAVVLAGITVLGVFLERGGDQRMGEPPDKLAQYRRESG